MYKLTVVAGPNRGTSYAVNQGETSIGRQTGNVIVLPSSKVSKRHCVLVVDNEDVVVKDQGSSNGTFVNGVLTKARKMRAGDRISVGEFVLELTRPAARPSRPAAAAVPGGNVIQFQRPAPALPSTGFGGGAGDGAPMPVPQNIQGAPVGAPVGGTHAGVPMPTDLKGKLLWQFETKLMPVFYGMNLKTEWRSICVGVFAAFILANLVVSVYPQLEASRSAVVRAEGKRAQALARQIVERNAAFIAAKAETKTEIGLMEREDGVRMALLMDLDSRVIAPATKMNQYLTTGGEASLGIRARNAFRQGRETGIVAETDSRTITAIEPLKVLSPQLGKNVVAGMALVSIDTSLSTPDLGEMGVIYSQTLILTGLLGALALFILYRLTLKPFQVLNDDIDKVLKGDMGQVTREFRFGELESLWDVINSALQRVSRGGSSDFGGGLGGGGGMSVEDIAGPLRMLGAVAKHGFVVCDGERKVLHMNAMFEEISGIRADNAVGQELVAVARDQALGALVGDLFDRAPAGGEGVSEDFDFSGVSYKVHAAALGSPGATRCYLLAAVRNEG